MISCKRHRNSGFSLFELLIALLILSVGLLGLATLQSTGIRSNDSASRRTAATFLVADIADRMRANMRLTGSANGLETNFDALANSYAIDTTDGTLPSEPGCDDDCSAANRPGRDAYDWAANVQAQLPGGRASVTRTADATDLFLVTIMWDDYRTGATGTACGGDPEVDLTCFQTLVQP